MELINPQDSQLSVRKQSEILGINRTTLYYEPVAPSELDISLETAIKGIYVKWPFYGHHKVTGELKRKGYIVGHNKVGRIRNELGLYTIYPKPRLSVPDKAHKKYPYLLKDLEINRVNQVWASDISYVKVRGKGSAYVVVILDWYSRYILSYEVSISLEVDFCISALKTALKQTTPEIFNSDQGSQYTSNQFLEILENKQIRISMDSKGRCLDNVICERFWRSLKYENIFLAEYDTVPELRSGVEEYIEFYNNERIHQSLNYFTPEEVYFGKVQLPTDGHVLRIK
jgi:putative transposase